MDGWAYVVIYSQRSGAYGFGEPLRVLWKARVADARRICMDERTAGTVHFLGWTRCKGQRVRWVSDDGRYDGVLRDLGLRKEQEGGAVVLVDAGHGSAPGQVSLSGG